MVELKWGDKKEEGKGGRAGGRKEGKKGEVEREKEGKRGERREEWKRGEMNGRGIKVKRNRKKARNEANLTALQS